MPTYVKMHPEKFLADLQVTLGNKLETSAEIVKNNAKIECPVRTGRLQKSIDQSTDKTELRAIIGSDVEYAYYVEMGTRKMTPRAYLRKGLMASYNAIRSIFSHP